ncbi:MAG: hypothetical protein HC859_03595, partial [Bacteroidia bacterium]|nr:hypothetical protein [Bacteroidia bacterium]
TIVKEWLYQVLSPDTSIVKNPGSYNSQLGVPLSVLQIQAHHQLGIFEAGISTAGEMLHLAEVIQPTLGVFTNIGPSHDEGFADTRQKIREKLKLFSHVRKLVYCADHELIHEELKHTSIATCSWGTSADAHIHVAVLGKRKYEITHQGSRFSLELHFDDKASIEKCNACSCRDAVVGLRAGTHTRAPQGSQKYSNAIEAERRHQRLLCDRRFIQQRLERVAN